MAQLNIKEMYNDLAKYGYCFNCAQIIQIALQRPGSHEIQ